MPHEVLSSIQLDRDNALYVVRLREQRTVMLVLSRYGVVQDRTAIRLTYQQAFAIARALAGIDQSPLEDNDPTDPGV